MRSGTRTRVSRNEWSLSYRTRTAESACIPPWPWAKCRHAPACSPLMDSLRDPSHNVRGLSAWALGNLGDERAIEALINALEDEGESVRLYAYQALDAFGPKALPGLENAREGKDRSVRAVWTA